MNTEQLHDADAASATGRAETLDAVRSLYSSHGSSIHAYLGRRVGRDLADDLLADTFRIALEEWESYDPTIGSARNWLYGISTNLIRRHWRTERRRRAAFERVASEQPTLGDSVTDSTGDLADRIDAADDAARLLDAVADLDADDYDLLVLTAWESLSSADVAEVLGVAPGTVRSRLHRIRRRLDAARQTPAHERASSDTTTPKGDLT